MIVHLSELGEDGDEFEGEESPDVLGLGEEEDIKPASPIRYRIRVSIAGDGIVAQGALEVDLTFACVRCAEISRMSIREPEFMVARDILNKDESIDLTQDIRESILLAFPTNPICAPDCRGLCQRCRKNLNKGTCRCVDSEIEDRWGALSNLKLK